jgi:hypothetical protein
MKLAVQTLTVSDICRPVVKLITLPALRPAERQYAIDDQRFESGLAGVRAAHRSFSLHLCCATVDKDVYF